MLIAIGHHRRVRLCYVAKPFFYILSRVPRYLCYTMLSTDYREGSGRVFPLL